MHAAKQAEREAEKVKKEEEKREKLQKEEALKFQKLLNAKIPEESRKTTKTVTIRANLVKQKLNKMERSQDLSHAGSTSNTENAFVPKKEHKTLLKRQEEQVELTKAHIEAVKKLREIENEIKTKDVSSKDVYSKDVKAKNKKKGDYDSSKHTFIDSDSDNNSRRGNSSKK